MAKKVLISIFKKTARKEVVLGSNGNVLNNICVYAQTTEDIFSGNYVLEAEFVVDNKELYKHVTEGAILKVRLDYGDEIFRISKLINNTNRVRIVARQITIEDTLAIYLSDVRPVNQNGAAALTYMLENSNEYQDRQYAKDIEVYSDITTVATAYYQEMNLYKAMFDSEQSFMNRWGNNALVVRRGYRVSILKDTNKHSGVTIMSRKNLLGFERNIDTDKVITRIKPKGFNGITINGYIDSALINNYPTIKTKEIKYEDVKVRDENTQEDESVFDTLEEAQAELIRRANLEFEEKHIDELQADYTIKFIDLAKTEEYKDLISTKKVYIGDLVYVYESKHNIKINVKAVSKKYDILKQEVLEIQLSNKDMGKKSISIRDIISELEKIPNGNDILQQAKENATNLINAGLKDSYVVVRKNEILIMNTQDINTATNVWRWNRNGLGFSSTGYNGSYGTAITNDGNIVADFITTGVLNANLIKAGSISNKNRTFELDLEGSNGIILKSNGHKSIELNRNMIELFDWEGSTRTTKIGMLYGSRKDGNANKPGISLSCGYNSYLSLGYQTSGGSFYSYIDFDNDNLFGKGVPILLNRNISLQNNLFYIGRNKNHMFYNSTEDNFVIASGGNAWFYTGSGEHLYAKKHMNISKNCYIDGNLNVFGRKNCIQKTKNYGERLFYATEDCESLLTDTGKGITKLTDNKTYEAVILLDTIYKECVDTSDYYVFLTKYNKGDIWIKEQTSNYFIVESEVSVKFNWKVEAKRKGFENVRLEEYKREGVQI